MRQKITWPYRRVRGPRVAKRTRLVLPVPAWLRWWLFGATTGIAVLWVMIFDSIVFPLALVVLVVLVVRTRARRAGRWRADPYRCVVPLWAARRGRALRGDR